MPEPDVDLAILGGGCAGLSLAYRLAGSRLRVLVIEPRQAYEDDRTWSFWRLGGDPFADCVRARWARWAVAANGETARRSSQALRYQSIGALAFYDKATAVLDAAANVTLSRGTAVLADPCATAPADALRIETTAGAVTARWVVDTRPGGTATGYGQYFIGREIQVDGAVFDDAEVELMSFAAPRSDGVDFIYTLPFTSDRALVEATTFAATRPGEARLRAALNEAIEVRRRGRPYEVVREERGFIPMQGGGLRAAGATSHPRWIRAGLVGGAARPSTGYAFQRIQAAASIQARALIAGAPLRPVRLDGAATRWMDALFLRVLQRWPERAPSLFMKLFRHAPADRLERFLSGSTLPQDRLAVIGALPPMPFLRELLAA